MGSDLSCPWLTQETVCAAATKCSTQNPRPLGALGAPWVSTEINLMPAVCLFLQMHFHVEQNVTVSLSRKTLSPRMKNILCAYESLTSSKVLGLRALC